MAKPNNSVPNHSYFPILVEAGYPMSRDALHQKFKDHNIYTRRYFYPLISSFPMYEGIPSTDPQNLPVATAAAQNVLCLPIYPALTLKDQHRIIQVVRDNLVT